MQMQRHILCWLTRGGFFLYMHCIMQHYTTGRATWKTFTIFKRLIEPALC